MDLRSFSGSMDAPWAIRPINATASACQISGEVARCRTGSIPKSTLVTRVAQDSKTGARGGLRADSVGQALVVHACDPDVLEGRDDPAVLSRDARRTGVDP